MNKEFKVHMLNEQGKVKAKEIAEIFDKCLNDLENVCFGAKDATNILTPTRYFSLVKTKLEEACFFAKKEMAEKNCE